MEKGRVESLKRRIARANSQELASVVADVIRDWDDMSKEVVDALKLRLSEGKLLDSWTMGKLVVLSREVDFYKLPHLKSHMLSNVEVLAQFLRAGIPDKEVEERLCLELENRVNSGDVVFRRYIVEALRDSGSLRCLPTLQAIEYDFSARYGTALMLAEAKAGADTLAQLNRGIDIAFGKVLKDAISAVKTRNNSGFGEWREEGDRSPPLFHRAREYVVLAQAAADSDPAGALNNMRKAIESLLKTVLKCQGGFQPKQAESIDELLLPTLIGAVNGRQWREETGQPIHKMLEIFQTATTLGSHDQGSLRNEQLVTKEFVIGLAAQFNLLETYFLGYVGNDYAGRSK